MALLKAVVHPGSSRKEVRYKDGDMHVYITAKPHKGEANKEAVELLSKHLGVAKSLVVIHSGLKSKVKTFRIEAATLPEIPASDSSG